jgi:gliding motility-associated-like protein
MKKNIQFYSSFFFGFNLLKGTQIILFCLFFQQFMFSQEFQKTHIPGTSCIDCPKPVLKQRGGNGNVQNGNASLGVTYNNTACGLNYTGGSVVIQQRSGSAGITSPPMGSAQPATINISGIPVCANILKAYLYADASGNGVAINASVTNPSGGNASYPMAIIGTDVDKCWSSLGYSSTYSYRADVTASVTGNGNYAISGLPVYPAPGPNDVDGATLLIIYSDPAATYNGTLIIEDGAAVSIGSGLSGTISGYSAACANSNNASWFTIVADLQGISQTDITINGSLNSFAAASDLWWNYITNPTTITAGQTSSAYSFVNSGDCFNVEAIGFYYQTSCTVCTPAGSLTVTANPTSSCAGNSATAVVTGGSGSYSYTWSPSGGNAATTTNIPGGTYTVTVKDNAGCSTGTATCTIAASGSPILSANSASICNGSAATLTVTGATTYTWSPATGLSTTSGSIVTANPTTSTTYTITGASGACTGTISSVVTVNPLPTITVPPGSVCNGAATTLTASGANTYTWSPATGLSSTTGATVTANPPSSQNYVITGTDVNGCVNTGTTSVTVVANPSVTVNTATICLGQQTATLTANGCATYTWSPATGLSTTSGSVVTANPAATTVYTINGAVGTCTAVNTTTVTVNPIPTVTLNTGTICVGQQTANLNAGGAAIYTWTPSNGLSATNIPNVVANPTVTTAYTVAAVDANGCANFATTTVTVNSLPPVSVSSTVICSGASASVVANGALTYTWTPATGLSSTNGSPVTANPTSTTIYSVTGTDANGCTNTDSATVTVVNNPTVTVTSGTICLGQQTATLTATGATTYAWNPGTGLSAITGSVVTATPANTTVYTITGTVGTCTSTGTTTVTVNPLPVPTIGSNSPVCLNQTLNLNSGGALTYTWSGPNVFSSNLQNPSITGVTIAANGTYTVTVTDADNCVNKATVNVVINSLPVVTAIGSTVCLNSTINLTAVGGTSYSWSGPLGYSSNQQNPTRPNATSAMAGSYVVTVTDANNCVNANIAQVVVNPLPTVTANSATICGGQQSATLTATGANTYMWTPATGLSSSTGSVVTASPLATTQYTVTGTDANNCQNTGTLIVTVAPLPAITISPSTSSGCSPVCVSFTNTANGIGTCSWNFGDGTTSNSCTPNHCFTGQGTFYAVLTLTDVNGCVNTSTATVIVYPVPVADFNASPQPTTILEPNIQFTNATTGAVITSYNWNLGDPNHTASTVQNPVFVYQTIGTYPVLLVVTSDMGCKDSTVKYIKIDDEFMMYVPNAFSPNADGTNDVFFAKGEGVKDFKMYIFDRWGNQIFFSDDIYKGWDGRFLSKGSDVVQEDVYIWKIECKTFKGEARILKGHVSLVK